MASLQGVVCSGRFGVYVNIRSMQEIKNYLYAEVVCFWHNLEESAALKFTQKEMTP